MKTYRVVILFAAVALLSGCYLPISGRVIDAETNQPIEGAVVLVEWTKTKGYGFTNTESYKVVEAVSDKEGRVKIEGCFCPFTNPPNVTVYKKGYVAWNNKYVFPSYEKRNDFQWGSSYVFRLANFDEKKYSHKQHVLFIYKPVATGSKTKRFDEAIRSEDLMMQKEIEKQR